MIVTGIITCHNYADLICGAIRSFQNQDYPHKRLVVIDDGSNDGTREAIDKMAKIQEAPCETSVFYMEQNRGAAWCRNFAMEHAWDGTDVFAFLDADDEYLPGKLSKSIALMTEGHARIGVVYTDENVIDSLYGRSYQNFRPPFSLEALAESDIVGGNFVVNKKVVEAVGKFDESMKVAEGYDFVLRAVERHILLHIPEPLVNVRLTNRALRNRVPSDEWLYFNRMAIARHGKTKA